MRTLRHPLMALATIALLAPAGAAATTGSPKPNAGSAKAGPLVIGHRGASGYRPEHTLASYRLAAEQGADFVEPDLVITKDGVLVARHENEIGGTTDVATHPEFAARKKTKVIDGTSLTGWFTEDFTLAELKTLRAKERIPAVRPDNTRFDGQFQVPTLQEVLDLRKRLSKELGRQIGVYPETKHPSYFRSIGKPLEPALVRTLNRNGLNRRGAPVFVQSFEVGNLKALDRQLRVPLVQLLDEASVKPADDDRTYGELATPAGLRSIARYADGVGPWKNYIIPRTATDGTGTPTSFVADAHAAGLLVHPYTFRRENSFVPLELRSSATPAGIGDLDAELRQFIALGVDGFFTDNPDVGVSATFAKPTLEARALLPATATAPAPFAGVINTTPAPAAGATQPIGGFSALLDAPGDDYWAMPDNGFGNKANSKSFLLRVYRVRADHETAAGGSGTVKVVDSITLRDPDRQIPFANVTDGSADRLLTGGDFDIESMRVDRWGDLWFGDEFGPFLLHTDASGRVLEAPIALPGVKSPDYPADYAAPIAGAANLGSSNGFEGMAVSPNGRMLYPVLEGAVAGDQPRVRRVHEFDIANRAYTGRTWSYEVADPSFLVADLTALGGDRFVALERDNFQGTEARHKQGFVIRIPRSGSAATAPLAKRAVFDLLKLRDPATISLPARPGDVGLGNPFSMPYVTIESVLPIGGDRVAIVNDTNFGSTGRNPGLPDDSDFIVVGVPGLAQR